MEEAKVICVINPVGNETIGLLRGKLDSLITLHNACVVTRTSSTLMAKTFRSMPEYGCSDVQVNISGCMIIELGPNSKLFDIYNRANSSIITQSGPRISLAKAN